MFGERAGRARVALVTGKAPERAQASDGGGLAVRVGERAFRRRPVGTQDAAAVGRGDGVARVAPPLLGQSARAGARPVAQEAAAARERAVEPRTGGPPAGLELRGQRAAAERRQQVQ